MTSMKKIAAILAVVALPGSALAATTVTFDGEVISQTCSVNINGQANALVKLPSVSINAFGSELSNGQTAGLTAFTVSVTDCAAFSTPTPITTNFTGYDVDATTGTLGNRTRDVANAAKGFSIQLMSAASGGTPIKLSGPTAVKGMVLPANATSTSYAFGAQYIVTDATVAAAGKISAVAEYSVSYF